jgi:hypothetical protein
MKPGVGSSESRFPVGIAVKGPGRGKVQTLLWHWLAALAFSFGNHHLAQCRAVE